MGKGKSVSIKDPWDSDDNALDHDTFKDIEPKRNEKAKPIPNASEPEVPKPTENGAEEKPKQNKRKRKETSNPEEGGEANDEEGKGKKKKKRQNPKGSLQIMQFKIIFNRVLERADNSLKSKAERRGPEWIHAKHHRDYLYNMFCAYEEQFDPMIITASNYNQFFPRINATQEQPRLIQKD
jgi:hypothetical protein